MTESTLSLTLTGLQEEVGFVLGIKRDSSAWSAEEQATVTSIVNSGLRKFYFPETPHEWSFFKPTTTLTTTEDDADQDLPDLFGSLDGEFTFASAQYKQKIKNVGEGIIRQLRADNSDTSGVPLFAAIRPKANDGSLGQRFEVMFFPKPNDAYVLSYRYHVLPNALTAVNPYPLGGASHAETIQNSCLAVAEQRGDGEIGIYTAAFDKSLQASIIADKRQAPDNLGYNADRSSERGTAGRIGVYTVTYNGQTYTG